MEQSKKISRKVIGALLSLLMVFSCFSGISLTAFAAPTCPNPSCGSTNVEPFGNVENEWECLDCGYIFGASFGGDEDDITFTKVTDASQITAENIGTCAAEDAKSWAIANWDDVTDSYAAVIAFYSNTGELNVVWFYCGLSEEEFHNDFDNYINTTTSISDIQQGFDTSASVFICTPAAPAEDGPLVGTVIKVGDTLTLDGDYIEQMPGVSGQATDSFKLDRMEYDDYFNGWGFIFEGTGAFLIAGDETPEPDGFYVSGGNGTQSHPYTLALHYASAEPASFTKVTSADEITAENIGTCTAEEAKAWMLANWDDVNEGSIADIAFYSNTGELNIVWFSCGENKEVFSNHFDDYINTTSSISDLQEWFDDGDTVFICTAAAATAYAGYVPTADDDTDALAAKVVKFNGYDWYLIEDNSTSETEGTVTLFAKDTIGSSRFDNSNNVYSGSMVKSYLDNLTAEGGAFADVADAIVSTELEDVTVTGAKLWLLSKDEVITTYKLSTALNKCSNDWWLRTPVYSSYVFFVNGESGSVDNNGNMNTYGVRPALQLDLSKVEFDSETNTFSVPAAAAEAEPATVYLKVEQDWWNANGPAAAGLYYWSDSLSPVSWPGVRMEKAPNEENVWTYEIPAGYKNLIFTRVSASGNIEDMAVKTAELTLPTDGKNMYTITSTSPVFGDPGVTGEWGVYSAEASTAYPLWVGGTQVTSANASNITGAETPVASFDADTNTLTLNGYTNSGTARADIQSGVNNAAIYYNDNMFSPNPLTIQLAEGTTNSLTMTGDRVYGIYVFGSALTITGNGTLNVQSDDMAINDAWGVAITGGTVYAASSGYYGINSVTIGSDISAVTVTGKLGAIYGGSNEDQELINAVAGTGWTDTAGTTGKAAIAISTTGQNVSSYKKVYFTPHTHDFTYSVSGATITATCTDGCPAGYDNANKPTLTIDAPTLTTYGQTGEGISAAAALDGLDAFNAATGLNVDADSIVYWKAKIIEGVYKTDGNEPLAGAPTNAGNYLSKITVSNCIASVGYTIAKADPSYTVPTDLTATYGDTLADVELPAGWAWDDDAATSVGNVGTNTFKATFTPTDTANYNTVSGIDVTVTVNHIPGDIDGDGEVNNKDLTRLFQYLSDWDVEVNEAALDVNGDGKVNNKDLTRLFQYLSDWDVEIF